VLFEHCETEAAAEVGGYCGLGSTTSQRGGNPKAGTRCPEAKILNSNLFQRHAEAPAMKPPDPLQNGVEKARRKNMCRLGIS